LEQELNFVSKNLEDSPVRRGLSNRRNLLDAENNELMERNQALEKLTIDLKLGKRKVEGE